MLDRLKMYLGVGPTDAYVTLSARQRIGVVLCQIVFVVALFAALFVADSWLMRAVAVGVGIVAIVGPVAIVPRPDPDEPSRH